MRYATLFKGTLKRVRMVFVTWNCNLLRVRNVISCNGPANEEIGNEECQLKMRVGSLYATLVRVAVVAFPTQNFHHLSFDRGFGQWQAGLNSVNGQLDFKISCAINSIKKDYIMICNNRQGIMTWHFSKATRNPFSLAYTCWNVELKCLRFNTCNILLSYLIIFNIYTSCPNLVILCI